jgi:hypothetical protein
VGGGRNAANPGRPRGMTHGAVRCVVQTKRLSERVVKRVSAVAACGWVEQASKPVSQSIDQSINQSIVPCACCYR